jgi:hypothetical protein
MSPKSIPKIINSVGLAFDIAGAWLVAIEVVNKFNGNKYEKDPSLFAADEPPYDSAKYKEWESVKHKYMWSGLICLTIGFVLQILSNWPCLFF